jgi:cytosine/adenosine deaminase-related metal-dependent hydrolase
MAERLLIEAGTVLTMDPDLEVLAPGQILVEDGRILGVGADLGVTDAERIEMPDAIAMPGFVDTHRHTWQAPLRLLASDWTLGHYLMGIHSGFSKHFRPQDTYIGNLLGTSEALDSGITTLLDWSHNLRTPEHADAAVEGLKDSGARAVFAHGSGAEQWSNLPNDVPHSDDVKRLRDRYFSSEDQLVTLAMALRGPQFATKEATLEDYALAREVGTRITVHVGDGEWGRSRPIEWLRDNDLLSDQVTYVHCNELADDELAMIADSGGTASVAATVEMQMGHGWPATGRLLDHGIRPSLSIDVCSSIGGDMFGLLQSAISSQRALDNAAATEEGTSVVDELRLTCKDMVEFATLQGARACGLDDKVGSLAPGKEADVILIRTDSLSLTPMNNPWGAVVYAGHPGNVDTVLVKGRVVKRDGKLLDVDVDRVRRLATETRDHLLAEAPEDPTIAGAAVGGEWIPEQVRA